MSEGFGTIYLKGVIYMRRLSLALSLFLMLVPFTMFLSNVQHVSAEQDIPSYAKWGRLAMKETQSKYPNANIVDYLHRGSEVTGNSTIEKFKLWLKEDSKEFGVFIIIEFDTLTEKVIKITFRESTS